MFILETFTVCFSQTWRNENETRYDTFIFNLNIPATVPNAKTTRVGW